jgi:hypothetical protein
MPVYKLSHDDYLKIRNDPQYDFLSDNAKTDHGEFMKITLSHRSRDMLIERLGIDAEFVDMVHHVQRPIEILS